MAQPIGIEIRPTSSEMEYTIERLESNTQYNLEVIVLKVPRYSYQQLADTLYIRN